MARGDGETHQRHPYLASGHFYTCLALALLRFARFRLLFEIMVPLLHSPAPHSGEKWRAAGRFPHGHSGWFVIRLSCSMPFSTSQGTFDYRTTVRENMTVFALSTMTSSVLVYNVQHGVREDHLQVSSNLSSCFQFPSCSICSCSPNMGEWLSDRLGRSPSRNYNSWYSHLSTASLHIDQLSTNTFKVSFW